MIYTVVSEKYKPLLTTMNKKEAEDAFQKLQKAFQLWEQKDKYSNTSIIKRKIF